MRAPKDGPASCGMIGSMKWRFSRGFSIVGAIASVAVLGIVVMSISALPKPEPYRLAGSRINVPQALSMVVSVGFLAQQNVVTDLDLEKWLDAKRSPLHCNSGLESEPYKCVPGSKLNVSVSVLTNYKVRIEVQSSCLQESSENRSEYTS